MHIFYLFWYHFRPNGSKNKQNFIQTLVFQATRQELKSILRNKNRGEDKTTLSEGTKLGMYVYN